MFPLDKAQLQSAATADRQAAPRAAEVAVEAQPYNLVAARGQLPPYDTLEYNSAGYKSVSPRLEHPRQSMSAHQNVQRPIDHLV